MYDNTIIHIHCLQKFISIALTQNESKLKQVTYPLINIITMTHERNEILYN